MYVVEEMKSKKEMYICDSHGPSLHNPGPLLEMRQPEERLSVSTTTDNTNNSRSSAVKRIWPYLSFETILTTDCSTADNITFVLLAT